MNKSCRLHNVKNPNLILLQISSQSAKYTLQNKQNQHYLERINWDACFRVILKKNNASYYCIGLTKKEQMFSIHIMRHFPPNCIIHAGLCYLTYRREVK